MEIGRPKCRCSQNVIATSEKFACQRFPWPNCAILRAGACGCGIFETGVTWEFAQIFFRDDKDLRGKQREDPKNPYRTGIFGVCHILKYFAVCAGQKTNCYVEILHDSNTLDKTLLQKIHGISALCDLEGMEIWKFHCRRILLVYLENARGNSPHVIRNKGSPHAHRRMRTALVCDRVELLKAPKGVGRK